MDEREQRRRERAEAAAEQAAAAERRRAAESARAQVLLDDFVREVRARGVPDVELTAAPYRGRGRYRTGLRGWYLKRDRTLGVDVDGRFYLLTVPGSLRARLGGVQLEPHDPPLAVGVGARDGESMSLQRLLELRLDDPAG